MSGQLEAGDPVRLVLTTCPDEATARRIARALVEARLIACGNVVPGLTSIYRWRGAIEEAGECLLLMKAPLEKLAALAERMGALHPYEVPELLVLEVESGAGSYLAWVLEETRDAL
jgi:periplasmic divalent cation tolerance protein